MRISIVSCFDDLMLKDTGASIRILNLARNLALFGQKVRVVIPATNFAIEQTEGIIVSKINGISSLRLLYALSRLLRVSRPLSFLFYDFMFVFEVSRIIRKSDVIQIEQPWAAGFLPLLIKRILKKPLVIDSHDVFQALRIKRSFFRKIAETFLEKMAYECADIVLVVSEKERQILLKSGVKRKKIWVIPNGVDTNIFAPLLARKQSLKRVHECYRLRNFPTVVFVGNMEYSPNQEAVHVIASKLAPLIRKKTGTVNFLIVGRTSPTLNHLNLIFTGVVNSVPDFLAVSDVAIAPLFHGSGSRLKIIEYFSCGLPVVSTTLGIEGLEIKEGVNVLVEDDMERFAAKVIKLIEDKNLSRKLGRKARELAVKKYDWQKITKQLVDVYLSLFSSEATL